MAFRGVLLKRGCILGVLRFVYWINYLDEGSIDAV